MNLRAVLQQMRCTTPAQVRRHPTRYVLSVLSVAAAVAMFVSMRITQASITDAFERNLRALAGGAEFRVTREGGVAPELLQALERERGVTAAPVVQGPAMLPNARRAIQVVGVDPVRELKLRGHLMEGPIHERIEADFPTLMLRSDAAVVPKRLAERLGLHQGDSITLSGPRGPMPYVVAGILKMEGAATALDGWIVFLPMRAAQKFFDRGDQFDRIDVALEPPATPETIRAAVGDRARIEPATGGESAFAFMRIQFQTILACVSLLAAVIGLFIVYNTMSLSVVQRAKEIGVFRALGARRREILGVIVGEGVVIGLAASAAGLAAGRLIGEAAVEYARRTLTLIVEMGRIECVVPGDAYLVSVLAGTFSAAAGALAPARAAAMLPPVAAMRPGEVELRLRSRAGLWMTVGVALMALCLAVVNHAWTDWVWSVSAVAAGLFGAALCGPQLLLWATPWLRRAALRARSVSWGLALDNTVKFPSRTSLTVFALGGSLSLIVAMTSLTQAVQEDIDAWMREIFVFDFIVQSNDPAVSAYPAATFPGALVDEARRDPAVREAYGVRICRVPFRGDEVMVIAFEQAVWRRLRSARAGADPTAEERRQDEAMARGEVVVSHNFARLHHVGAGESIELETPSGRRAFHVAAVRKDYSWFRGCILMELDVFRRIWDDPSLSYIDIAVHDGVDPAAFQASLAERWSGPYGLHAHRTSELSETAARYTREWFSLVNVQLLLAMAVGGFGVANTLLFSVLTQQRQIGLLRAVGASLGQVRKMLAAEAAIIGVLGGMTGCVMGMLTVAFLVTPMAAKSTGYDVATTWPWGAMGICLAAGVAIALGAAVWPARGVRRIDVIAAIGYE